MRSISRVLAVTMAMGTLASNGRTFAQNADSDGDAPASRTRAVCAATQCLFGGAPVLGAPFSAEASLVWSPPPGSGRSGTRTTARYYRDSAGRVRVEQAFVGSSRRADQVILATNAETSRAYVLDPAARTSTPTFRSFAQMMVGGGGWNSFVQPVTPTRFLWFGHGPLALSALISTEVESLGQKVVAGVQAEGTRFTTTLPVGTDGLGHGERWVSPDLQLVVYSRSEDATIGVVEYALTRISRSEPRADLFEVPSDYTEVAPTFRLSWMNPYTPATWPAR